MTVAEVAPLWIHPDHPAPMTIEMRVYCQELAKTGLKLPSFRKAYPKNQATEKNQRRRISVLDRDERVIRYIAILQRIASENAVYTLDTHIAKLQELRDLASADGQYAAAISAEKGIGNATGHQTPQGSRQLDKKIDAPTLNITRPKR